MKWFERLAGRRAPDLRSSTGLTWVLTRIWRLRVALIVKTHTMESPSTCEVASICYVLNGHYQEHRLDGEKDTGDWCYSDVYGDWVVHEVGPHRLRAWSVGEKQRVELYPARRLADKMLDMPEWMTVHDVDYHTEMRVWLLVIAFMPKEKK